MSPDSTSTRPRKRQCPDPPEQTGTSQPLSKKQRLNHTGGSRPAPAFWDNLTKLWLTKRALEELDRRNSQAALSLPHLSRRRARRPVTRKFRAEQKANTQVAYCTDYLPRCSPSTLKNIRVLARHGGPDLSDLRNYPEPVRHIDFIMSSSQSARSRQRRSATSPSSRPTTSTTRTKSTGVYDRDFQQHLVDHAVYPQGYRRLDGNAPAKPENWKEVHQILELHRPSLSPSRFADEEYEQFVQADADASKEKQVSESVIPIIEGKTRDAKCRSGGIPFTNLDHLTDGTLKPGNPDVYYGARPEQLSRKVRDELNDQIIPSTQHDLPTVPNFFLAAKGPDGSAAVAKRQACYDGALGARGMHRLLSYGQGEPVYNNAATITSIYHDGTLKMYTSHIAPPPSAGDRPEYHMTQVNTWGLTGNLEACQNGLRAYRNAQDWCKEQRDKAIRQANERANSIEAVTPTSDAAASPALSFVTAVSETEVFTIRQESRTSLEESDSSEDLAVHRFPAKRPNKRLERAKTLKRRHVNVTAEQSEPVVDGKR
ncbi:hypothetical protein T440DRAFT_523705 [Plenodomus tracheiphilus IPT5]|uniref:Uncharacterized protein n=1 Tax=Plenodomus tracheiphilus IPT5 TaxID=1408161 RepID=A0A6A7AM13_9PLEO|nr:hypothetical protein T440DRAFT_523705 [Plenodomus tracheiphilus IPT5]